MNNRTMTITSYPTVSFTRIESRENISRATIDATSKNFQLLQESILKITKKPSIDSLLLSKEDLEQHEKLFIRKNYINRSKVSLTRAKPIVLSDLEKMYSELNINELKDPLSLYVKLENYPDKLGLVKNYQTLEIKTNKILSDMFRSLFHPSPYKLHAFNNRMMEQLTLLECLVFSKINNMTKLLCPTNNNAGETFTSLYNKEYKYKQVKTTLDILTEFEELGELFKKVDFEIREEQLSKANLIIREIDEKLRAMDANIKLVENLKTKNNQKRNLIISLAEIKFFNSLFQEVGTILEFDELFVCSATIFDIKDLFVYLKRKHKVLLNKKETIMAGFNERLSGLLELVEINDEYKKDKLLGVVSKFQTIIVSNFFDGIIPITELNRYSEESTLNIIQEMTIEAYLKSSKTVSFAVAVLKEMHSNENILNNSNVEVNSLLSLGDLIQINLDNMIKSPDVLVRNFCKTFIFLNTSFLFFVNIKEKEFISPSFIYKIIDQSYSDILNIITIFIDLLNGKKSYILLRLIQIVTCALNDLKDILNTHGLEFNITEKYEMLGLIFKSFILSIHVNNICDYKENLNSKESWNIVSIKQVEFFRTLSEIVDIDTKQLNIDKDKKLQLIGSLNIITEHLEFYFKVKKSVGYLERNMGDSINTLNNDVDKCIFDFFDPLVKLIYSKVNLMDIKSKKQIKTMLIFIKTIDNIFYISDVLSLRKGFIVIDSSFFTKLNELRNQTRDLVRGIVNEDTIKISDKNEMILNEKKIKIYEKLLNTLLEKEDVLFIMDKTTYEDK